MQQREKLLAGGLGVAVAFWIGLPMFESTFIEPLTELSNEELRLMEEDNTTFQTVLELKKKEKQLAEWRKISLPPDPLDAQRLYAEWVTDLAKLSGFDQVKTTLPATTAQGDIYVRIPVSITAEATLQELAQFMEKFESVELLHRVKSCNAISPASDGNPELQVTFSAEGMSLTTAPARRRLFPQIELPDGLKDDQTALTLKDEPVGFPKETPFRARIDDEFVNVTKINGKTWTLQRGVARTFSHDHAEDSTLELFPILNESVVTTEDIEAMWTQSLFTKPAPQVDYDPKLATTTAPPVIRGRDWDWTLSVESWNPTFGSQRFSFVDDAEGLKKIGVDGLKLDERAGKMSWSLPADAEMGERHVQIMVWGSASKEAGFTSDITLRVRDPNEPPTITQEGTLKFFLGRASEKKIATTDPDGSDTSLKYEIENGPEGMTIGNDGIIRWTPAESMDAQSLEITVKVTDSDELAESDSKTFTVSLEEDSARYTKLSGTFLRSFDDGKREWKAMLYDQATNRTTSLTEGQQVTIADFEMTVTEVGEDFVQVVRPEGTFRIGLGLHLVDMVAVKDPEPPMPTRAPAQTGDDNTAESNTPADSSEAPATGTEPAAPQEAAPPTSTNPSENAET